MEKAGGTVPGLAVGKEDHAAGLQVIAVELIELVPAGVLAEDEPPRVLRRVRGAPGRIGQKSEFWGGSARGNELEHLNGLGGARGEGDLPAGRVPASESSPT